MEPWCSNGSQLAGAAKLRLFRTSLDLSNLDIFLWLALSRTALPRASQIVRKMSCRNLWQGLLDLRHLCSAIYCSCTCVSHRLRLAFKSRSVLSLTWTVYSLFYVLILAWASPRFFVYRSNIWSSVNSAHSLDSLKSCREPWIAPNPEESMVSQAKYCAPWHVSNVSWG